MTLSCYALSPGNRSINKDVYCVMLRGGSWINNGQNCRSAYRNHNPADNRNQNIGFRLSLAQSGTGITGNDQIVILFLFNRKVSMCAKYSPTVFGHCYLIGRISKKQGRYRVSQHHTDVKSPVAGRPSCLVPLPLFVSGCYLFIRFNP